MTPDNAKDRPRVQRAALAKPCLDLPPAYTLTRQLLSSLSDKPVLPRWGKPNWCDGCGRYHPRDYTDCVRRAKRDSTCPGEFGANGKFRAHCPGCGS